MDRQIVFFPAEGEPKSPSEIIDEIEDKDERQTLRLRLEQLSQREPHTWSMDWCKHYEGVWQLRTRRYRVIIVVEHTHIIVLDAFKKQGKRQSKVDTKRREKKLKAYLDYKERTKGPGEQ
jgi:mRNA-degrading endonuclease RelE of RelBE toxin-antitoxin system